MIFGDEEQRGVDLGHAAEGAERMLLAPELVEGGGAR
jgi:hypothetical protein